MLAIDRNPTLQGGYSDVSIQSETTGKGKFDHNEIRSRKRAAASNRGQRQAYPNGSNEDVLCALPREHLIARRKMRNFHANRGEPTLSVFSSLNGLEWGRWPSMDAVKRSFIYVGRNKNKYLHPGQPRGLYQTETGLSWIESGKASCEHTGTKVIQAGELVCLEMPPTSRDMTADLTPSGATYRSKSTLRGGQHLGKYLMMTEPVDPTDFGSQLMGAHALFRRSRNMPEAPGVADVTFREMYTGILGKRNQQYFTDGQDCSGAMLFGLAGVFYSMIDALEPKIRAALGPGGAQVAAGNLGRTLARDMGVFSADGKGREDLLLAMDSVFKQNIAQFSRRRQVMDGFRAKNQAAFAEGGRRLKNDSSEAVQYAQLTMDALRLLLAGISNAQYEKNRWIIGKASNSAAPGDTLDIVYGMYNRPMGW